ncbi:MAG: GerMN domain-containing protein [Acidimicrobiia bacterium]
MRSYFLRDEKVGPVSRQATGGDVASGAVEGLLAGPTSMERDLGLSTAIPEGTTLLGVRVDDRVATVDLSEQFTSGGGSASMRARVAQVVFTLTQFPTVDAVSFQIDGEPLTVLGGEGVLLERPQGRIDWEGLSPAILLESPLPSATVASPLRLTGTANTFEAVFWVRVTDGAGAVVYDRRAMASSGTGTRGSFDITATLERPVVGVGAVTVFEKSAKDGEPTHTVEIPVRFVDH